MKREIMNNLPVALAMRRVKISKVSSDTGISRTTLTRLCREPKANISTATLQKLCNYLNCEVSELLTVIDGGGQNNE